MNNKLIKALEGGFVATVVMTLVMVAAAAMGGPKMSPPHMLAGAMGMPIALGWLMHFMIGVIFALVYAFVYSPLVRIKNSVVSGAVYGVAIFIFAQIMMAVMGAMMPMPQPEGSMPMILAGGLMGHIIFAVVVALFVSTSDGAYADEVARHSA